MISISFQTEKQRDRYTTLARACERTFHYRKTEFDPVKILELLERLKRDDSFLKSWEAYSRRTAMFEVSVLKLSSLMQ
jgi:hypothetical protein